MDRSGRIVAIGFFAEWYLGFWQVLDGAWLRFRRQGFLWILNWAKVAWWTSVEVEGFGRVNLCVC